MNKIPEKDLDYICSACNMKELEGKTVLITGATGLIGKTIVYSMMHWNMHAEKQIHIIASMRNRENALDLFQGESDSLTFLLGDIRKVKITNYELDYVIHAASPTSSKSFVDDPVGTIDVTLNGTKNILEQVRNYKLMKFIYLSTMEVYGTPKTDQKITESYPSNLNLMSARTSYPESKRMCENLCASYCSQYNIPVNVLRLTQTFGPGVEYSDTRLFAELARCVIEDRDIILKTKGETKRSYLYTADAITAIFKVLLSNVTGEAFNVANENTYCSVFDMAQMVVKKISCNKINIIIEEKDNKNFGFAETLHMNLDTTKIKKLGWDCRYDLSDMLTILINYMQNKSI